jgi:O-antigen ligase
MEPSAAFKSKLALAEHILYFLLVFSLFFPIEDVLTSNSAFQTGAYSDFTAFTLYLSDIIILALLLVNIHLIYKRIIGFHVVLILLAWVLFTFLVHVNSLVSLNYYFLVRFLELIFIYLIFSNDKPIFPKKTFIYSFVGLGTLEAILGIYQFLAQKSLGLYRIGESHLNSNILGVAKIVSHGTKFIRAYGTFPHSNILSAFLFTTILFSVYLLFISEKKWQKIFFSFAVLINIFALTTSFSRAGLGVTILISVAYLGWLAFSRINLKKTLLIAGLVLIAFVASFATFHQFLFTRATVTDEAVKQRAFYNHIGVNIVKAFPWQGIGFGASVLHMQQFSPVTLEPWEIQPIHNYYLLAAAEIGIIGGLLFLIFFLRHLFKLFMLLIKNRRQFSDDNYIYKLTLTAILCGFLLLMLFDHYFYTIVQPQLLLWVILGLMMNELPQKKTNSA